MKSFNEIWKGIIQKPGPSVHSEKWDRCVADVKAKNPNANAYAVCTAQLGEESFKSQEEIDKMGLEGAGSIPKSLLARQDLKGSTEKAEDAEYSDSTKAKEEIAAKIVQAQKKAQKAEINARKSFKQVWKDSMSDMIEEEEAGAENYEEIAETFESMAEDEKRHAMNIRRLRDKTQTSFKESWRDIKPRK